MKKITLIIIVNFLLISAFAQEHKTFYESGELNEIGNYTNGMRSGEWKTFFENG